MHQPNLKRKAAFACAVTMTALCASYLPMLDGFAAGDVVINEVCTKNTTLAAPDGNFYDYVELYNSSSTAVSVAGYGLSDSADLPYSYTIPAGTSVPAKGYLVIYCGIDSTSGVSGAAFGLSKKGETVILTDAGGNTLETLEIPALDDDTAYGRVPDGSSSFAVLSTLSAGSANPSDAVSQVVVDMPAFSKESGFYADGFSLTLSAKSGCTIYYTTDGSDPTPQSTAYTGAITVYDKSDEANVYSEKTGIADSYTPPSDPIDKAMIVRAIAVDADGNVSKIATNSYFIGYTASDYASNMRVISLVTDPYNLFDYEYGIYVQGKVRDDWRNSSDYNPRLESYFQPANYTQSGREWEREAYMTVFESGTAAYSTALGIRIHGGATRSLAQKSLNLYARSDYGDTKFDYDFFGGMLTSEATGEPITSFDSLTLRNGGNDQDLKLRDRLNQELMQGRSCAVAAQTECVVFLDGEFWGLYNLMEKQSEDNLSDHYGVKAKDVCRIKTDELSDGTEAGWADYEALKAWATETDYTKAGVYETFVSMVEPQSFADYMAAQIIVANQDFGTNNYALWKTETVRADNPYADGRWRFIFFDTEFGQGLYGTSDANSSILSSLKKLDCWIGKLFYGLLENVPEFRQLFVTTYFDLCNENFKASAATARVTEMGAAYTAAGVASLDRFNATSNTGWGGWGGWGQAADHAADYANAIASLRTYWNSRAEIAKTQLISYLGNKVNSATSTVTLKNEPAKGSVSLNTLTLSYDTWSGSYLTENPITLEAQPKAGYTFAGWVITGAEFVSGSSSSRYAEIQPTASAVTVQATYTAGSYSQADVQKLLQYLLTTGTLTQQEAASYDLDGSGTLTARDLSLLKALVM